MAFSVSDARVARLYSGPDMLEIRVPGLLPRWQIDTSVAAARFFDAVRQQERIVETVLKAYFLDQRAVLYGELYMSVAGQKRRGRGKGRTYLLPSASCHSSVMVPTMLSP